MNLNDLVSGRFWGGMESRPLLGDIRCGETYIVLIGHIRYHELVCLGSDKTEMYFNLLDGSYQTDRKLI